MKNLRFSNNIKNNDIINKFNKIYNQSVTHKTAKQVLERIADSNGWNPEDEIILANTSVDDYCTLFKSEKGERLYSFVRKCLKFGKVNGNEQQNQIAIKATDALKKIASESEINKRRVTKIYDVNIDDR